MHLLSKASEKDVALDGLSARRWGISGPSAHRSHSSKRWDRKRRHGLASHGIVGLSDAYVYLKRFDELSNGQQYRAMLAKLIAGGANVWLADEFCANLDSITANVVADGLQRIARQLGPPWSCIFTATGVRGRLRPDHVLQLTTGNGHTVSMAQRSWHV